MAGSPIADYAGDGVFRTPWKSRVWLIWVKGCQTFSLQGAENLPSREGREQYRHRGGGLTLDA